MKYYYCFVVILFCAIPQLVAAQPHKPPPPGKPTPNKVLEQKLKDHPQRDQERVDLLVSMVEKPQFKAPKPVLRKRALEALSISKELGYKLGEAKAFEVLASSFDGFESPDSLSFYYSRAHEIYELLGDEERTMRAYFGIGKGLFWLDKYEEAIDTYIQVLDYFEGQENYSELATVYRFIGLLYLEQNEVGSAITNFEKSVEAFSKLENNQGIGKILHDLAKAYWLYGDYAEALPTINRAIDIARDNPAPPIPLYITKGKILLSQGRLDDAKTAFQKALDMGRRGDWLQDQPRGYYFIAQINFQQGNFSAAKENALEALNLNEKIDNTAPTKLSHKVEIIMLLAKTEQELGNSSDAFTYVLEAKQMTDSLTREENLKTIADLTIKYEADKKEQEILLLRSEKKGKQRLYFSIILGVIFIFTITGMYFWNYHKRKQEQKRILLESMKQELQQFGWVISEKNNFISKFKEDLEGVRQHVRTLEGRKELTSLVDDLHRNTSLDDDEELLFEKIKQINTGFFTELRRLNHDLTPKQERLATLVQMELTNKDIANILHVDTKSVKQAKRRLKRKLQLDIGTDLSVYLKSIVA